MRATAWCLLEYAPLDHSRGYCGVFSVNQREMDGPTAEYLLRLRGLDRSREHLITLDNSGETFRMAGRELANTGLIIQFGGSMLSDLILYAAVATF